GFILPKGNGQMYQLDKLRYFTYRKLKYFWYPQKNCFVTISQLESELPVNYFHHCVSSQTGLSDNSVEQRLFTYGKNLIEVKVKPLVVLLFKEAITPFYIFQVFSVTVWYMDNYAYFASIIVAMSVMSIGLDVYQIRKQERKLRSMVHTDDQVQVLRNGGKVEDISSANLVHGDILLIPPRGCILQCDAVLMTGTAMLTGESMPITKVAMPETDEEHGETQIFSFKEHSKHILYCGTQVLQTRYYPGKHVQAVVLRTAYSTLKGQLVRSIMYPKPVDFRFTKDLFKFVGFLACIAGLGFLYTILVMISRGSSAWKIIIRSLDIITIVVPPALPAAMSIGIFAAQMRLRAKQIFCISPSTINTCGAINTVCFDKTGTLTEDGLDFNCFRAIFPRKDLPEFGNELHDFCTDELPENGELLKAVATCHSLTRIDKVLNGDPLDLVLFRKTVIRSPPLHSSVESEVELAVIRQFTFSSHLQRMSVLVHNLSDESHIHHLYCKGAPEKIASLCLPETLPYGYQSFVDNYAQQCPSNSYFFLKFSLVCGCWLQPYLGFSLVMIFSDPKGGYRLIAVASRRLNLNYVKAHKAKREHLECDLVMLGLIVMENRLKPQTIGVINQLNRANIRTIMITGDNILTAMSVARECGIIRPNKRSFLLEAGDTKCRDGRTHLVLKQSVSSSDDVLELEEDTFSCCYEQNQQPAKTAESSYHLAISGPTLSVICEEYPEILEQLICVCDVYARMSPDQKQLLVNQLQDVGYTVAMCGDGANDCAALKAAHAGISLSEAEASIAAPFTSKTPDIRCVPTVIREGRAALVTSFGVFKYMAGYSLTQFVTIMQLYWLNTNLTDLQFLYIDLALVTLVSLFFGYTPACERLAKIPPPTRLLSLASIFSVIGQLTIISFFQVFTFIYTSMQPWFIPYATPAGPEPDDRRSMQGTAVFCVSMFQYITLAIIYSKGFPYRRAIFRHKKQKQLLSGSSSSHRFERILLSIGNEPNWLRILTGGSTSMSALNSSFNGQQQHQTNSYRNSFPINKQQNGSNGEEEEGIFVGNRRRKHSSTQNNNSTTSCNDSPQKKITIVVTEHCADDDNSKKSIVLNLNDNP
uniref:Cation-transporting P-type ATPase N-terminal domain-containing protein n=1 Tax=Meloidogyne javanica TaxID=6303 RepID=A0A915LQI8_MELJA